MENLAFITTGNKYKKPLKYPSLREQLLDTLKCLSDYDYQYQTWIKHNLPDGMIDNLDIAVNFLFDDTVLADNPESAIGVFLYDESEVNLIKQVIDSLNQVFDKLGLDKADAEYINSPLWQPVIKTASQAYQFINSR